MPALPADPGTHHAPVTLIGANLIVVGGNQQSLLVVEMIESRKIWKTALLAVGLSLGTWLLLRMLGPAALPPDFPARPDLKSANAALVTMLEAADAQARSHPNSAEDLGRLGMAYHANQFYEAAERAYRIASRLDPADYRWIYYQALVNEESGREEAQSDLLQKTLQLRPDYVPALQKQGDIFLKQGNLEPASRCYTESLTLSGANPPPQALFGLARVAERRRDWRRVIESLAPLSREHPLLRPPYQLLADSYEAVGESEKAAATRASLLQPNLTPLPPAQDPLYDELLVVCCSSTRLLKEAGRLSRFGHRDQAIQVARRAAEVDPGDADVRHFLARTLLDFQGGDPPAVQEALGHLNEGLRLRPDDLLPLFYFATFFFDRDKTEEAVEQLRAMLARNSGSAQAHYYLGVIAGRRGQNQEAIEHYREALERDPGYAEPCEKLGLFMMKERKFDEAIAYFRKAVRLKPSLIRARCNLGVALEQQGKMVEAIEQYIQAVRLKPNDGSAQMYLAIALLKSGKIQKATEHFRNVVLISPGDPEAHYGLGFSLAVQQQVEEAREEFREALRLRPGYAEAQQQLQELEREK